PRTGRIQPLSGPGAADRPLLRPSGRGCVLSRTSAAVERNRVREDRMTDRPATSERSYLARTYDDDRFAWTRSKRVRRRLVVAEAVLISALVVLTIAAAVVGADRGWLAWPWSIALLGFVPIHSFLNLGIRGLYDRSER